MPIVATAGMQLLNTEGLEMSTVAMPGMQQSESEGQDQGSTDGTAVPGTQERFRRMAMRLASPGLAVLLLFGVFAVAALGQLHRSAGEPKQTSLSRVEQKSETTDKEEKVRLAMAYSHPNRAAELGYGAELQDLANNLGFLSPGPAPTSQPAEVLDRPVATPVPSLPPVSAPTLAPTLEPPSGIGQVPVPVSVPTLAPLPPWSKPDDLKKCPGTIQMSGYGPVQIIKAGVNTPGVDVGEVEVAGDVRCHMEGRTYFGDTCSRSYSNSEYLSLHLLGKTLKYTVDLSGSACGCNAAFYLVSMHQNNEVSDCNDYYCDANKVCGVRCAEIDIQEANMHAWYSTLHVQDDGSGKGSGFGAYHNQFDATQYGIGGSCIDTQLPFEVAASFPIDVNGHLRAMKITLSQQGKTCPLSFQVDGYSPAGRDGMQELSEALAAGMTPVISYWGKGLNGNAMQWMDGLGPNGQGPCAKEHANSCGPSVAFSNFAVTDVVDTYATSGTFQTLVRK